MRGYVTQTEDLVVDTGDVSVQQQQLIELTQKKQVGIAALLVEHCVVDYTPLACTPEHTVVVPRMWSLHAWAAALTCHTMWLSNCHVVMLLTAGINV